MRDAPEPITALQHILTDVKDKERPDEKQDVICKMICFDCQGIYIGETGRNLNIRLQSCNKPQRHNTDKPHTQTSPTNETQHSLGFGYIMITYKINYKQGLTLESTKHTNSQQLTAFKYKLSFTTADEQK